MQQPIAAWPARQFSANANTHQPSPNPDITPATRAMYANPPREWVHDLLALGQAARQMIASPKWAVQPPFPCVGVALVTLHSMLDPPTFFLFGGSHKAQMQNDLFPLRYVPTQMPAIHLIKTRGSCPSPQTHALLATRDFEILLWGGHTTSTASLNRDNATSLYTLSLKTHAWSRRDVPGVSPAPNLHGLSATSFQTYLYLFAGNNHNTDGSINSDFWRLDLDLNTGQPSSAALPSPIP
ncbi:hypothetical protein PCANC_24335 [Puccinia coronata f. sp. avenae]|uniref:Uncharacterized protein n=1 Tax=Puccinia coronata f. sp. avenae TaxID=200324 RepID=A0A2N5TV76_9BASI|nr:hypothetical protein PCANC_24335 [Puccinia coronata f. sp. avenae]